MGYATIVLWLGVFVIAVSSIMTLCIIFGDYVSGLHGVYDYEKEVGETDRTEIDIKNVTYIPGILNMTIKNTGSELIRKTSDLKKECIDIFIDDEWLPHENFSITLLNTSHDPLLWNPGEYVLLNASKTLNSGNHVISVVVCNGVKDSETFGT